MVHWPIFVIQTVLNGSVNLVWHHTNHTIFYSMCCFRQGFMTGGEKTENYATLSENNAQHTDQVLKYWYPEENLR